MKRVSLVLALAALSVPAAASAAHTHSQPASPAKASVGKVRIHGTVKAIAMSSITVASATKSRTFVRGGVSLAGIRVGAHVEAEGVKRKGSLRLSGIHRDDRGGLNAGTTKASDDLPGDDRGGLNTGTTKASDDLPGDDRGGHGLDDGPGHH